MLVLQRSDVAVHFFDGFQLPVAVHVAQFVDRLTDQRCVDAGFFLRLEDILDRHRAAAAPERILLLLRCLDVGVEIDDHGALCADCKDVQGVAAGAGEGDSSSSVLPAVSIENSAQVTPPTMAKKANMP